jgi:ferredoxin
MIKVRFLKADGTLDHEVDAPPGTNLLDLAQAEGQPLEGACEGQMACSTCHVVIAKEDFGRLPVASEEEDDLLDFAWAVRPTSRLACQINLTDDLGTLTVQMPGGAYNLDR